MDSAPLREYAQTCLKMADEAGTDEQRRFLVEMAGYWHERAQEREQNERPESGRTTRRLMTAHRREQANDYAAESCSP